MKHRLLGLIAAVLVILLDQITKRAVVSHIETGSIEILPFFNIVLVWNQGISFGLLNHGNAGPILLSGVSLAIVAMLAVWLWQTPKAWMAVALGAVIGGALGNVIDRLRLDAVADFLDFHIAEYHWPAFNIADSAIVVGIAFIVIDGLFFEPKEKKA